MIIRRLFATFALVPLFLTFSCNKGNGPIAPTTNEGISACFTWEDTVRYSPGETIEFDASCCKDALFRIIQYTWDWGDGSKPESFDFPTASHIFSAPDSYHVIMTIRDEGGRTAIAKSPIGIGLEGNPPKACFIFEAPDGWQPGCTLQFDASQSSDPDGDPIRSYSWDWGDGYDSGVLTTPFASHKFDVEGEVQVRLTVEDSTGWETVSEAEEISFGYPVGPPIVANLPLPGWASDVAISGDLAYVACQDGGLQIVDISNPVSPTLIGSLVTGTKVARVKPFDHYVLMSENGLTLDVVDVQNPSNPVVVGSIKLPGSIQEIAVKDGYAYVADYSNWLTPPPRSPGGLRVVDVSDPTNPRLVARSESPEGLRTGLISGDYFFAVSNKRIGIVDISTPTVPSIVGQWEPSDPPIWNAALSGDYLYVTLDDYKLLVLDISDPVHPREVNSIFINARGRITLAGDLLITAHRGLYQQAIDIVDISAPSFPRLIGGAHWRSAPSGLAISGKHLFLADWSAGLTVIDISEPHGPHILGSLEIPVDSSPGCLEIIGDFAYLKTGKCLHIIDISNPLQPALVRDVDTEAAVGDIAVSGGIACMTLQDIGLVTFDVTDPGNPVRLGTAKVSDLSDLVISGGYAYIAGGNGTSITIVDIRDPSAPVVVGSGGSNLPSRKIAVGNGYAYLYSGPQARWIDIIDVRDVSHPYAAGSLQIERSLIAMAVHGDYLYILRRWEGGPGNCFTVKDISNPLMPVTTGWTATLSEGSDMRVVGRYAYLDDSHLTVIDVSDPTNPRIVANACAPKTHGPVAVRGNLACLASVGIDGQPGFSVIKLW